LLAKPSPLNINLGRDRFSMFNKKRDIPRRAANVEEALSSSIIAPPAEKRVEGPSQQPTLRDSTASAPFCRKRIDISTPHEFLQS
jgi:hypothetical protein